MRKLPVFFVVDVSESMIGEPLAEVEKGLESIVCELRKDPYALETVFISLIVFAGSSREIVPLTELTMFKMPQLHIGGGTCLGKGLDQLMQAIDRDVQKTTNEKKGDWKPIIFLFTDGSPTDDPTKAIEKWRKGYASKCNLVVVTFGSNSAISTFEKLGEEILTLRDTSPESFREFFKWVSASVQVSSMAVANASGEDLRLVPMGINLEKAKPGLDENFALLNIKCQHTKGLYIAKYDGRKDKPFPLIGAYKIEEDEYNNLSSSEAGMQINVDDLDASPLCPYCGKSQNYAQCGKCNKLFCAGDDAKFKCPWCGHKGMLVSASDFTVGRNQG